MQKPLFSASKTKRYLQFHTIILREYCSSDKKWNFRNLRPLRLSLSSSENVTTNGFGECIITLVCIFECDNKWNNLCAGEFLQKPSSTASVSILSALMVGSCFSQAVVIFRCTKILRCSLEAIHRNPPSCYMMCTMLCVIYCILNNRTCWMAQNWHSGCIVFWTSARRYVWCTNGNHILV